MQTDFLEYFFRRSGYLTIRHILMDFRDEIRALSSRETLFFLFRMIRRKRNDLQGALKNLHRNTMSISIIENHQHNTADLRLIFSKVICNWRGVWVANKMSIHGQATKNTQGVLTSLFLPSEKQSRCGQTNNFGRGGKGKSSKNATRTLKDAMASEIVNQPLWLIFIHGAIQACL